MPTAVWSESFALVKAYRERLRESYGIPLHKELHARDLVAGRGELGPQQLGNPIPSAFGQWPEGPTRDIPTFKIIEDPVFRSSKSSFMLQLADCVAFALLKRESPPTPVIKRYGVHRMFDDVLAEICFSSASRYDPLGIVRK